eukprot:m.22230 g.22230  ORF g.22230 m.22230 type:complete len:54 (-) comp8368_c0_seq3:942-1103(-)
MRLMPCVHLMLLLGYFYKQIVERGVDVLTIEVLPQLVSQIEETLERKPKSEAD